MVVENGEWTICGLEWDNPERICTWQELIAYIDEVGFLPLFQNEIAGFSVEEHVYAAAWWTGDLEEDPWQWRELIAKSKRVAYGKFFGKKSGFISLSWLPYFANYRRDGYDFDALWDDGLASIRSKKIMDVVERHTEIASYELKQEAGFGKGGEKNFNGIITDLQMQTYLTIKDFRRKRNKKGAEYGMAVSVYAQPEELWGRDLVTSAYSEQPETSKKRIYDRVKEVWGVEDERVLKKVL